MDEGVRRRLPVMISIIALMVIIGAFVLSGGEPATEADRVEHIASRIKCPMCASESIADATSAVARDLEIQIAEKVAEGATDEEVYGFFAERYGDHVLLDPPLLGWGWALWALPLAGLLAGGAVVLRRRRPATVIAVPVPLPGSAEEERLREQLDHVARDQRELARQAAVGEIDSAKAAALSVVLERESGSLESALEVAGTEAPAAEPPPAPGRSRRRALIGAGVLVAAGAVVTVALILTADTGGGGGIVDAPPLDSAAVTPERLEEVIATQPDVVPMRMFLARMLVNRGDLSRAAFHFEEVLLREDEPEARAWLEWIDTIQGEPSGEARTARLEAIVTANPDLVDMQVELAKVLADEGELLRAATYFGGVLEAEPHPEAMAWMGWIAFQVREYESAEQFLVDALAVAPDYPQAQWWLANVRLLGLGDAAGAVAPLEALLSSPGVPADFRESAEQMLAEARAAS